MDVRGRLAGDSRRVRCPCGREVQGAEAVWRRCVDCIQQESQGALVPLPVPHYGRKRRGRGQAPSSYR